MLIRRYFIIFVIMNLPSSIPHYLSCPYCQFGGDINKARLEWQKANPGSITETLVYYCDNCKLNICDECSNDEQILCPSCNKINDCYDKKLCNDHKKNI